MSMWALSMAAFQIMIANDQGLAETATDRPDGMAYDPSWAPDGSRVVFVTQENESDDIWVIEPDSSGQRALMRNDREWDRTPLLVTRQHAYRLLVQPLGRQESSPWMPTGNVA